MNVKYLIWLRNIMFVLFVAQLGYFIYLIYQRFFIGVRVEWNSSSIITLAVALGLLQSAISKQTTKE